jgi:hypothetical protein
MGAIKMMFSKKKYAKANKHHHISNKRFIEYTQCYICGSQASSTHEIFHNNSSYMRNMSIFYKAQIPVCMKCHKEIHESDGKLDKSLKQEFQRKIMRVNEWTVEEFRKIFYKNYLED